MREDSFRWIKILFEPEHKYTTTIEDVEQSNALLTKLNKTADEGIDDESWETIFRLRVVLTVPAMWPHQAKDRTAKAARAAGLPVDISMVTEPEAAALSTSAGESGRGYASYTLVQNQTMEVQGRGLKAILLVGGFGESKYLHSRLENTFTSEEARVLQVDGAWSAIYRGACMWGLEQVQKPHLSPTAKDLPHYNTIDPPLTPKMESTIVSRISRYIYGVPIMENFDSKKHL
ncbi:hypothetical protein F4814DRAFT_446399 [Daldinia grandis]|nr:hypothetical protein F4814DRAFT_446399 [Daldinia grandis]